MFSGTLGIVHTLSAVLALIFGTVVLLNKKGTSFHKRIGYAYAVSMVLVNGTAFGLYNLFGGFGLFHVLALISFLTLLMGMIPVWNRKQIKHWYIIHLKVMSWSVVGLYAALAAEISTRFVPREYFMLTVGISSLAIIGIGGYWIYKVKRQEEQKLITK